MPGGIDLRMIAPIIIIMGLVLMVLFGQFASLYRQEGTPRLYFSRCQIVGP
jgi:hypothetical protein